MLRLALIQIKPSTVKSITLQNVQKWVKEAVNNKAQLICLPECFNSPYGVEYFKEYAENEQSSKTCEFLSTLAKEHSIHLVGGSIPEEDNGKLYNTCCVYNPDGIKIAKHRKVHLFDIDVPGGIKFTESDVLSAGNQVTTFNVGEWKIGIGICYDLRFPELSKIYEQLGCHLLLYPGAFNMTTGPKHWQLLTRARATDHQLYTAACSSARDVNAKYVAWGHSLICDPWAQVIAEAGTDEEFIYADLDMEEIKKVRQAIPIRKQKRFDVYESK